MKLQLTSILCCSVALASCNYPHWYFDNIDVTGYFDIDGSCGFEIDGEEVSDRGYRQNIFFYDRCAGCPENGLYGYFIFCKSDKPRSDRLPMLALSVRYKDGTVLHEGDYKLLDEHYQLKGAGAIAEVFDFPREFARTTPGVSIALVDGVLNLDSYDEVSNSVAGQVSGVGKRRRSEF